MAMTKLRRASALALACLLTTAAIAFADTVRADGDQVRSGNQGFVNLGSHAPGEVVKTSVDFQLICGGLNHVDVGQSVSITLTAATVPFDGTATATSTSAWARAGHLDRGQRGLPLPRTDDAGKQAERRHAADADDHGPRPAVHLAL